MRLWSCLKWPLAFWTKNFSRPSWSSVSALRAASHMPWRVQLVLDLRRTAGGARCMTMLRRRSHGPWKMVKKDTELKGLFLWMDQLRPFIPRRNVSKSASTLLFALNSLLMHYRLGCFSNIPFIAVGNVAALCCSYPSRWPMAHGGKLVCAPHEQSINFSNSSGLLPSSSICTLGDFASLVWALSKDTSHYGFWLPRWRPHRN